MRGYLGLWVLIPLFCATAHADIVPLPPQSCPNGSAPASSHDGSYCYPLDCYRDLSCRGGAVCQTTSLCLGDLYLRPANPFDRKASSETMKVVTGVCSDNECQAGSTCNTDTYCVTSSIPEEKPLGEEPTKKSKTKKQKQAKDERSSAFFGVGCAVEPSVKSVPLVYLALLVLWRLGSARPRTRGKHAI